jgi:hypothetical protein
MDFMAALAGNDNKFDDWFAKGIENDPSVHAGGSLTAAFVPEAALATRIIQRQSSPYAVLNGRLEISLFEPKKAHRQLPKIVSFVTNR